MIDIKNGYNNKNLQIRISCKKGDETAGMWIEFDEKEIRSETLNYITLMEMIKLRDLLNENIKTMTGVE